MKGQKMSGKDFSPSELAMWAAIPREKPKRHLLTDKPPILFAGHQFPCLSYNGTLMFDARYFLKHGCMAIAHESSVAFQTEIYDRISQHGIVAQIFKDFQEKMDAEKASFTSALIYNDRLYLNADQLKVLAQNFLQAMCRTNNNGVLFEEIFVPVHTDTGVLITQRLLLPERHHIKERLLQQLNKLIPQLIAAQNQRLEQDRRGHQFFTDKHHENR